MFVANLIRARGNVFMLKVFTAGEIQFNKRSVMPIPKPIRYAHTLDAAWIIALWKAIHGGDPGPEQIALEAIAALSGTLTSHGGVSPAEGSFEELQTRLKTIGVEFEAGEKAASKGAATVEAFIPRTYCIVFKGQRICITLPQHSVWPPPGH
jgi:hypothetical protein